MEKKEGVSLSPLVIGGEQGERSAQIIQVDSSKYVVLIAVCALFTGLAAATAVWSVMRYSELESRYEKQADKTATEYRVSQGLEKTMIAENDAMKARIDRLEDKIYAKR